MARRCCCPPTCTPNVTGIVDATCPPTSTERSIDIDVIPGGACDFAVGARLHPCFGQLINPANFNLTTAPGDNGVWQPVTNFLVALPEAGCYDVHAEVGAALNLTSGANGIIMAARLFNVTAGAVVPNSQRDVMQLNPGNLNATNPLSLQLTAPLGAQICVAAPTTIRVEAQVFWTSGTGTTITLAQIFGGARAQGTSRLAFEKIAD